MKTRISKDEAAELRIEGIEVTEEKEHFYADTVKVNSHRNFKAMEKADYQDRYSESLHLNSIDG